MPTAPAGVPSTSRSTPGSARTRTRLSGDLSGLWRTPPIRVTRSQSGRRSATDGGPRWRAAHPALGSGILAWSLDRYFKRCGVHVRVAAADPLRADVAVLAARPGVGDVGAAEPARPLHPATAGADGWGDAAPVLAERDCAEADPPVVHGRRGHVLPVLRLREGVPAVAVQRCAAGGADHRHDPRRPVVAGEAAVADHAGNIPRFAACDVAVNR